MNGGVLSQPVGYCDAKPIALPDADLGARHAALIGPDGRLRVLVADQLDSSRTGHQCVGRLRSQRWARKARE